MCLNYLKLSSDNFNIFPRILSSATQHIWSQFDSGRWAFVASHHPWRISMTGAATRKVQPKQLHEPWLWHGRKAGRFPRCLWALQNCGWLLVSFIFSKCFWKTCFFLFPSWPATWDDYGGCFLIPGTRVKSSIRWRFGPNGPPMNVMDTCSVSQTLWIANQILGPNWCFQGGAIGESEWIWMAMTCYTYLYMLIRKMKKCIQSSLSRILTLLQF